MENTQKTIKFNPPPLNHMEVFNACAALIKNDKKTRTDKGACIKYLEDAFSNRNPNIALDFEDGCGPNWTPLFVACYYNFKEGVKKLIELGADPNFPNAEDGKLPLEMAAINSNHEITQLLLEANADANSKDKHGKNLLLTAVEVVGTKGDKFLEELLSLEAINIQESSPKDMTLLQFAEMVGNINGAMIVNKKLLNDVMENTFEEDENVDMALDFKL